jgi:hypothetical protein
VLGLNANIYNDLMYSNVIPEAEAKQVVAAPNKALFNTPTRQYTSTATEVCFICLIYTIWVSFSALVL